MANILFKKGSYNDFKTKVVTNKQATEGALYLTEDEGCLYLGKSDGSVKRVQGSVIFYEDTIAFKGEVIDNPPYSSDVIYFVAKDNALIRWDSQSNKWIIINATAAEVTQALADLGTRIGNEEAARAQADSALTDLIAENTRLIGVNAAAIEGKAAATDLAAEVAERQELAKQVAKNTQSAADNKTAAETAQSAANKAQEDADKAAAAAGQAAAAASAANANANGRVSQTEYNAFVNTTYAADKTNILKGIADNKTAIETETGRINTIIAENTTRDATIAGKLNIDGSSTMTGDLKMGGKKITGLANGTTNTDAVNKGQLDTAISGVNGAIGKTNENVANLTTALNNASTGLTNTGINLTTNQITLQKDLAANGKKITGLADGSEDTDAATVGQVRSAIAANDAMTFRGTLGSGGTISALPTTATAYSTTEGHTLKGVLPQKGDTFKVAEAKTYAGTVAKVGDLFINTGEDGAAPIWEHISSGYEDDYLQKLIVSTENNSAVLYITNGVDGTTNGAVSSISITGSASSNLSFSTDGTVITASMTWGTF